MTRFTRAAAPPDTSRRTGSTVARDRGLPGPQPRRTSRDRALRIAGSPRAPHSFEKGNHESAAPAPIDRVVRRNGRRRRRRGRTSIGRSGSAEGRTAGAGSSPIFAAARFAEVRRARPGRADAKAAGLTSVATRGAGTGNFRLRSVRQRTGSTRRRARSQTEDRESAAIGLPFRARAARLSPAVGGTDPGGARKARAPGEGAGGV